MATPSLLPVVLAADNFPACAAYPSHHPDTGEVYVPFHIAPADHAARLSPVGLLRPAVLAALDGDAAFVSHRAGNAVECVTFAPDVLAGGRQAMDKAIADTAARWRAAGLFTPALAGWRDELYAIYASPRSAAFATPPRGGWRNAAFACERAACAVWGFATFGVHMTAYEGEGGSMKIWVPRRSPTKATWPGMLDNTVAGGITAGMTPRDTMIKECDEEASLPASLVEARLRNVGLATYWYITKAGFLQPDRYLYDLPLPPRDSADYVLPRPHDDEVESFHLMTVPEVIEALHRGEFKPNCGIILVDFLIRHSLITPENEPDYIEICWHMRRRLGVGMPA
ncbi:uncharacterized protein COLE_02881 [Cutaneotrichosporon oleaginosum]|uniref:uncharacterized protein n=1 Tax=Cutaneotrichosporon oleaginosum TaxID=879819 RepID=UPI00132C0FC1|nr:hypothetical protein COLE_02881 [Cutaneotrichosporon oleaginosum]